MSLPTPAPLPIKQPRRVFLLLSPRSLSYARSGIASLLRHADEPIALNLITDSAEDKSRLADALADLLPQAAAYSITSEAGLADAEASQFGRWSNLRAFRAGHGCWRKITDPLLMSAPGEEIVVLDPDTFFPNRFRFEQTPATELRLMWQQPNCLLPQEVVRRALDNSIRLARHVDIGVAQWSAPGDDGTLEWLDWVLGRLGGAQLPRMMHVEAIVWSAIAMKLGGSYLDPAHWLCWHRTQLKRVARKLGVQGATLLRTEPWSTIKCFHAGGEAKSWVVTAEELGIVKQGAMCLGDGNRLPFVELSRERYEAEQTAKRMLAGLGYYRLFHAGRA
ncbi:hypothetical protein SAMN05421819_3306 [Bryocella elongata]|uniref:Nucleotide-diphospho-sugar transferase n=1 Tax=Bryocella elongata TaxID=863522 RepID=A0A1H6AX16_9BACT|nr:hypothetical protein [Bryocella elongata]SEG52595.1 hypothetical protein SAMN05421819_3306 [Bryocella elongata]